jgi:hypothetical protein
MALSKDVLGLALYNRRNEFCDKTLDELVDEHGSFEGAKLAMAKADAEEIINHFKANILISIPATGFGVSGAVVTGIAITGTIE